MGQKEKVLSKGVVRAFEDEEYDPVYKIDTGLAPRDNPKQFSRFVGNSIDKIMNDAEFEIFGREFRVEITGTLNDEYIRTAKALARQAEIQQIVSGRYIKDKEKERLEEIAQEPKKRFLRNAIIFAVTGIAGSFDNLEHPVKGFLYGGVGGMCLGFVYNTINDLFSTISPMLDNHHTKSKYPLARKAGKYMNFAENISDGFVTLR
jgi:hypothetical protein